MPECAGVIVEGTMSAVLCDDEGWVRSGTFHFGTDYKCTGSVHPPLDSLIWPGREVRCTNPIHDVKLKDGVFAIEIDSIKLDWSSTDEK